MTEGVDSRRVAIVDAFTEEPLSGKPAGVVPDGDGLTSQQLRAIARELSVGETVFLLPSGEADRRARSFTPEREVEPRGHAVIAAHAHLLASETIAAGNHMLETDDGLREIEVDADGTAWLAQDAPAVREVDLEYDRLAGALGVDPATLRDVGADLPLARAATGRPFLLAPVNFLEALGNADPDLAAIEALCDAHDAEGIYAFTFDTLSADATLHARAFLAAGGEDPATVAAAGACGAYLRHVGAFEDVPDEMVFEQGHFVDRPGLIRVRVGERVRVGGTVTTALEGSLSVPVDDEDEIIEA